MHRAYARETTAPACDLCCSLGSPRVAAPEHRRGREARLIPTLVLVGRRAKNTRHASSLRAQSSLCALPLRPQLALAEVSIQTPPIRTRCFLIEWLVSTCTVASRWCRVDGDGPPPLPRKVSVPLPSSPRPSFSHPPAPTLHYPTHLPKRAQPPSLLSQLRNVLEFGGGVTDTYLNTAKAGHDTWNILTRGSAEYRKPPGSQPQPRIPAASSPSRTHNITYYTRDVRRTPKDGYNVEVESSFDEAGKKLLDVPKLAGVDAGSAGQKNPDVMRYDPSGLRTAMTTNWVSLRKALDSVRPTQLPDPSWSRHSIPRDAEVVAALKAQGLSGAGAPREKRLTAWSRNHADMW
jgi:hypothetical protein